MKRLIIASIIIASMGCKKEIVFDVTRYGDLKGEDTVDYTKAIQEVITSFKTDTVLYFNDPNSRLGFGDPHPLTKFYIFHK